jgi:RNA polymerase sigma factor (sigma-70 family)
MTGRPPIDELIERSSLGTEGARELRRRTDPSVVRAIIDDHSGAVPSITDPLVPEDVLTAAAAGDRRGVRELIRRVRPMMFRYCRAALDGDSAGVVAVEACVAAVAGVAMRAVDPEAFTAFAYDTVREHVLEARRERRSGSRDDVEGPPEHDELEAMVRQLPPIEQHVIILRLAVGLSVERTAAALGLSAASVRKIQHRALASVRTPMDASYRAPGRGMGTEPGMPHGAARSGRPARPGGPTVTRIVIGAQLRRWREASGTTREAVSEAIGASPAKISRLELGRVAFKMRDIVELLDLYGITDDGERAEFLELVKRANARGWWHKYAQVLPSWFETYLGLEQSASVILTCQMQFVPGLLQTEEYARNVILAGRTNYSAEEIDHRVNLRMTRQKMLTEPTAPQLWAMIDEAALSRPFGTRQVMKAQLAHLLEMIELPNVAVQVMPSQLDIHAAASGAFTILRFREPDLPDVVYLEQLNSAIYLDKRSYVEEYSRVAARLAAGLAPPSRSSAILRRLLDEL